MDSAAIVWPLFNSLQAFWPGLQVLAGDIDPAIRTHAAFLAYGKDMVSLQKVLTLLVKAFRYLDVGRDVVASLQYGAKCPCGYCHITDVESHQQEDHMESFFLAETVKYLWLLFDMASGPDNLVENGSYNYIFSTEGHLLPATPQISLVREHCSYFGAYCRSGNSGKESHKAHVTLSPQENNVSVFYEGHVSYPSDSSFIESAATFGVMKGLCPGLTHGQKYGISYVDSVDVVEEEESKRRKDTVVKSHTVVAVSNQAADSAA